MRSIWVSLRRRMLRRPERTTACDVSWKNESGPALARGSADSASRAQDTDRRTMAARGREVQEESKVAPPSPRWQHRTVRLRDRPACLFSRSLHPRQRKRLQDCIAKVKSPSVCARRPAKVQPARRPLAHGDTSFLHRSIGSLACCCMAACICICASASCACGSGAPTPTPTPKPGRVGAASENCE